MKYMLMMHAPKEGWTTAGIGTWAPKDIKAHIAFMLGLNKKLKAAGEFVGGAGPRRSRGSEERARAQGRHARYRRRVRRVEGVPRRLLDRRRRQHRARVRDRGDGIGRARQGRRAAQHADRSAPGHERAADRTCDGDIRATRRRAPAARARAAGARRRRAPLRRLRRGRGRGAGSADRRGDAVAGRRRARAIRARG